MERPKIEDTKTPKNTQSIGGNSVNIYQYSKLQDEYIDYLEGVIKNCCIPNVVGQSEQLKCIMKRTDGNCDCGIGSCIEGGW